MSYTFGDERSSKFRGVLKDGKAYFIPLKAEVGNDLAWLKAPSETRALAQHVFDTLIVWVCGVLLGPLG